MEGLSDIPKVSKLVSGRARTGAQASLLLAQCSVHSMSSLLYGSVPVLRYLSLKREFSSDITKKSKEEKIKISKNH